MIEKIRKHLYFSLRNSLSRHLCILFISSWEASFHSWHFETIISTKCVVSRDLYPFLAILKLIIFWNRFSAYELSIRIEPWKRIKNSLWMCFGDQRSCIKTPFWKCLPFIFIFNGYYYKQNENGWQLPLANTAILSLVLSDLRSINYQGLINDVSLLPFSTVEVNFVKKNC